MQLTFAVGPANAGVKTVIRYDNYRPYMRVVIAMKTPDADRRRRHHDLSYLIVGQPR